MVGDPGQLRGPEMLCASSGCFRQLHGVGRSWETEWEENCACLQNLLTNVRFVFLVSTWAQERFGLPPPEGFLRGKMVQNGAPTGTANAGARDAFCIVPRRFVTSVGPWEVPGAGGKQHRGQGGMGTRGDSPAPWPGDIWPRLVLFSQRLGKRRGSSQAVRGL